MVRLGVKLAHANAEKAKCFNSTMVRLGAAVASIPTIFDQFQFHHGTIGRVRDVSTGDPITCFNSTMVRLGVPGLSAYI